ncbi:GWxTD domain-containing protein [Roseivirga sp.]|uniref:GWxTD domain-containing protein n=1 Tax=Roseivirga sp. TaxID=1964215 RepID=UPI003B8DCF4F
MKRLFIFSCLLVFAYTLSAQSRMSSVEMSYLYNEDHEFLVQHKVATDGTKVKLFLKFILNSGNVKFSDYRLSYDVRASYIDEKEVNSAVPLDSSSIIDVDFRQYVYAFEFDNSMEDQLVVVDIFNTVRNKHFNLDIPLKIKDWNPASFLVYEAEKDIPYFAKYITKDYPVRIVNPFNQNSTYEVNGVSNNLPVALPPFDESVKDSIPQVPLDTAYGVNNAERFQLYTEGIYKVRSRDYPNQQLTLLVSDEYHPYYGSYSDLVSPLIYVSTNDEYRAMKDSEDGRSSFESFVNNTISSNERVAKDFIKYYYRRIRKSARLFSEDREGWKTDRGMVFQVFGNPLQVFRNESTELWVFPSSTGGRLRFIFDIIAEDGLIKYKLIRGNRYRENWMLAVTQWRSGRIIE